jgi:sugar/nucleoside kinase (ribokinase family)
MPIDSITLHSGGCALSSAVDMSKIGLDTAVVGKIGNDGFGSYLTNELKKHGVETRGLSVGEKSQTSASVVIVGEDSERSFIHCFGANGEFTYEDIDFSLVSEYGTAFFTGVNLMSSFDGAPLAKAVKKARECGCVTIMDTAWDSSGMWMELVRDSLLNLDYFIPSYDEAKNIAGKDAPGDIADVFLSTGVGTAAIKMGEKGCFIKTSEGVEHTIPPFSVKAVETTGAGDAFAAGFITGISKGWPIYKCGLFANAVGALSVSGIGASTGIRTLEETVEFIKTKGRGW